MARAELQEHAQAAIADFRSGLNERETALLDLRILAEDDWRRGMPRFQGENFKKNLEVVEVDSENNLLLVKGSVPGSRGGYVIITRTIQ